MATLTYVYADSTAVLGPLASFAEPHCYDLCEKHSQRLTVPLGWEVIRLERPAVPEGPGPDDLLALADAVREAGHPRRAADGAAGETAQQRETRPSLLPPPNTARSAGRPTHLHILRD